MTARAAIRRTMHALPFAAAFATSSAAAADLSPHYAAPVSAYTAPQPVYSWTGLYAGFNAGYAESGDDAFNNLVGVSGGKVKGAVGGVQIGYNYQLSPMLVVGIENDFEGGDVKNHDTLNSAAVSIPWYMTGRARAGIATLDSRLLLFGTAGLATGELKDGPINKMKMGWTAGGGVEWAFLPKWSAKAEYLYTEFMHDDLPDWNAAKFHTFRVGVNYHFDLFR
ncbi:porin family protein [Bradyrhizobium sp. CCGB12]|uniref:outer membrane protein n=1 Tax=Bradyrhizobium sp. CCGB12 TaxID=2949632 RepID=UPI0020B29635|nr:outer membrane protein [Bradyrhizobium sp. CCGB12]MCP3390544.1 porin family protein [Bradyrhizobium sp. CCGB12]